MQNEIATPRPALAVTLILIYLPATAWPLLYFGLPPTQLVPHKLHLLLAGVALPLAAIGASVLLWRRAEHVRAAALRWFCRLAAATTFFFYQWIACAGLLIVATQFVEHLH